MFLLRWLLPWRRQKAQTVTPPTPTPNLIALSGAWRVNYQADGDAARPALEAAFELDQRLAAETGSTYALSACYPKAQSKARPTLLFELSGAFGLNRRLGASVQLFYPLTAAFDLATPTTAQASEYVLKGEYD